MITNCLSNYQDAQAGLRLCCWHNSIKRYCHDSAHVIFLYKIRNFSAMCFADGKLKNNCYFC